MQAWENEVHVKPKNQHTRFAAVRCGDTLDASKVKSCICNSYSTLESFHLKDILY